MKVKSMPPQPYPVAYWFLTNKIQITKATLSEKRVRKE